MHDEGMASSAREYWQRRRETVPSPTDASGPDDARGVVLVVDVTDAAVIDRYEQLRSRLGAFDCLRPTAADGLHLTVKQFEVDADVEAGRVVDGRGWVDEVVTDVAARTDPFEVRLSRFNLFPDVVYAEVEAGGVPTELNRRLCKSNRTTTLDRDCANYIPHVTLGYFLDDSDYDSLVDFLERNRDPGFPSAVVDSLELVAYDVGVGVPPTYECLATYELG